MVNLNNTDEKHVLGTLQNCDDLRRLVKGDTAEKALRWHAKTGGDLRALYPVPYVERILGSTYYVLTARGEHRVTEHFVTLDEATRHGYICPGCPGWDFNGQRCSHGQAVLNFIREEGNIPHVLRVLRANQREWYFD